MYSPKYRNSRPEVFFKKSVPKSLVKFRGKHMCRNLFLMKLESHSLLIYWKKKRSPQLFSCELFKIITKHLQETVPKNKREFYEILYPHGCSYGKCWFQFQLHLSVLFFSFGSTEKALEYIWTETWLLKVAKIRKVRVEWFCTLKSKGK